MTGWVIGGLIALVVYSFIRFNKRLDTLIDQTNRRHGTRFTRENGFGVGRSIFFDAQSRKLLIVKSGRCHLESFDYIRRWTLKWVEQSDLRTGSISYRDVYIEIQTNDYQTPLVRIPCMTKFQGDTWNAKMGLLFG